MWKNLVERAIVVVMTPISALMYLGIKKALHDATKKARVAPEVEEMLEVREKTSNIPTATRIAPDVELDYLVHRSAAYVGQMAWGSTREFSRFVTGSNEAEILDDSELGHSIASLLLARLMKRTAEDDAFELDFSWMRAPDLVACGPSRGAAFEPHNFEVIRFVFELPAGRLEIHDSNGRVHVPGSTYWIGAKAKLVAQCTIASAIVHSWTHFWLPDVVAAKVHHNLDRDTNLYRLLAPHTRFTNRHNHAGLWIQRSVKPGKKALPGLTTAMFKDGQRKTITDNVKSYYDEGTHFQWPERMDRRLPFFHTLASYWTVADNFVAGLMPELESDVYEVWAKEVDRWFPAFSSVPMRRALAMTIWQMGIAHAIDHKTFVSWGVKYGHGDVSRTIEEMSDGNFSSYERYRQIVFLKSFVDFQPPPSGLDLRLETSPEAYGFAKGSRADRIARQFVDDLRATDQALAREGRQLVPLEQIIRTICF